MEKHLFEANEGILPKGKSNPNLGGQAFVSPNFTLIFGNLCGSAELHFVRDREVNDEPEGPLFPLLPFFFSLFSFSFPFRVELWVMSSCKELSEAHGDG